MSCMLHIGGNNSDVDKFVKQIKLKPCAVFHK